jgi:hypothetical protein
MTKGSVSESIIIKNKSTASRFYIVYSRSDYTVEDYAEVLNATQKERSKRTA